jgi:hypothetical protein
MRWIWMAVTLVLLCFPAYAPAQGIIDASRRIDWSEAGIPGGIPNRTTICSTLNPGVTAAQINTAIAACPAGQVVYLNAGTYILAGGIDFAGKSNVTLRGAGPDQTFLVFTAPATCWGLKANICFRASSLTAPGSPAHTASWTSGYAKGTTNITLSNTTGLTVGTLLYLDQANDASDTGGIYVCSHAGCSTDGPGGGGRPGREQLQIVQVAAINGNVATITPGLHMPNWRSSQSPAAWWGDSILTMSGVEGFTIDNTASTETSGIAFANTLKCWVKNIRSLKSNRSHVWLYGAAHTVVRDSYLYGTKNAVSQSYGVEVYMGSAALIENNIFQHIAGPVVQDIASGDVVAYNFSFDNYYLPISWMTPAQSQHGAGTAMDLYEGNSGNGTRGDNVHGSHNLLTIFRNYYTGVEAGRLNETSPILLNTHTRFYNVVGNVLGTPGYHNRYESRAPSGTSSNTSIYSLGWSGAGGTTGSLANDPAVATTLLRWGNFDYVTMLTRWSSSEIPAGNAVPSNQNLPASFYLSAKPSWWGTMPWPAIGPDVTGGQDPAGHAHKIPARVCYDSSPKNADGTLVFNANNCYGNTPSAPPTSPTNLKVQ